MGKQAENVAEYLGKGIRVNIVGRLRDNNYQNADGADVCGLAFTDEEIDYLDSEADARRARGASPFAPVDGEFKALKKKFRAEPEAWLA